MDRVVYHVVPDGDGWAVKKAGASKASSTHVKKSAAVREGKRLAKKPKLGQIVIHGSDGVIDVEHTYGEDPEKYEG